MGAKIIIKNADFSQVALVSETWYKNNSISPLPQYGGSEMTRFSNSIIACGYNGINGNVNAFKCVPSEAGSITIGVYSNTGTLLDSATGTITSEMVGVVSVVKLSKSLVVTENDMIGWLGTSVGNFLAERVDGYPYQIIFSDTGVVTWQQVYLNVDFGLIDQ